MFCFFFDDVFFGILWNFGFLNSLDFFLNGFRLFLGMLLDFFDYVLFLIVVFFWVCCVFFLNFDVVLLIVSMFLGFLEFCRMFRIFFLNCPESLGVTLFRSHPGFFNETCLPRVRDLQPYRFGWVTYFGPEIRSCGTQ